MRNRTKLLALLLGVAGAVCAQDNFGLRDGDRVVFYGDSITDQRLYTTFTETYVVTRFPKTNITFVHSGWGGDRVAGGGGGPVDVRLWRDVLPYNPTVVTIMLGMNDGRYRAFDQPTFDEFSAGFKHITDVLKRQLPGVRITAIQPSPYDDVTRAPLFEGGYNQVLVRYGDFLKQLATEQHFGVADLNTSVVEGLKKANELDAVNAAKLIPDRVHPGAGGHILMAEALLKAWNAPALVADVEVDAGRKEAVRQRNSHVTDLHAAAKGIAWTQTDEALPMPVDMKDPLVALAMRSSDFMQALNQAPLKVRGLSAGRYALKIDGDTVGTFTAEQLAAGVNLAELPTPMMRQAAEVHALTLKHNVMHFTRWRTLQVPMEKNQTAHLLKALDALDELEGDLLKEQRAAAQPKARHFEVIAE
ncbi:MAG: lipolytic enzyme family [Candidatus Solibacter sp.]|jgi:lysophospholipase L1-like esterase|nr:lipolytic enzyme family [Candidatus Solibacter sp.]